MKKLLKKVMAAMLCMGLFWGVGCKKDNPITTGSGPGEEPEPIEYPIEIPFEEYTLPETCQWKNLTYEEWESLVPEVIIINSDRELENHVTCMEISYFEIDFSKYSLLLARGKINRSGYAICNNLQQLSERNYEMKVDCYITTLGTITTWYAPVVVNKLSEECTVELLTDHIVIN